MCVHIMVYNCHTQHTTTVIIFPLKLWTIIIAEWRAGAIAYTALA